MSAVEALRMAQENGIHLGVSGADLLLDAEREPAPRVLESIRCHKAEIVALLATEKDAWSAEDWQVFFDERAGIAEFDGELSRLIAAHNAAMECYRRAMIGEQTFEGRRENLNQANKLSRTWATMLDALNRNRGKGQQKVTVEHVHVHAGGQAMVGMVETPGGGDLTKMEEQPHAKRLTHAPEPALPSPDKARDPMPVARDGERPLPDARGRFSRRSDR